MTNNNLTLHYETQHFSAEVIQLCKRTKQRKPQRDERVFWHSNGIEGVGIVRLRRLDSAYDDWLVRGLWIAPKYRQQGFASQLMNFAISEMQSKSSQRVYAMASHHLDEFYSKLGFSPAEQETCPKQLEKQHKWRVWVYSIQ
ncbi:GNAT family N-acetyltransferase [Thiomicrospira cyclica]|uniref:GCN5-related N-acetyltransferase n=1 Tax=Thiomicrospira cyclica (strain DSM 14477 / JCM 11371 / ALM1) TaxID=717773 RepID=F6D8S0_THICA|nr:GNAT family N-acetyltransferase [Thiomicrospira cyclica]AEG31921.1 GCN5-related N-acetyltransferase [Thiomicrospira cyclica ALM1]